MRQADNVHKRHRKLGRFDLLRPRSIDMATSCVIVAYNGKTHRDCAQTTPMAGLVCHSKFDCQQCHGQFELVSLGHHGVHVEQSAVGRCGGVVERKEFGGNEHCAHCDLRSGDGVYISQIKV